MLLEAITYLMTPCDPRYRSKGYLKELIATDARRRRCRTAWATHLENTKTVIRDVAAKTQRRRKAVILGAGILSDIPIEELSSTFDQVELIDVCFLNRTRRRAKHLGNVMCRSADLNDISATNIQEADLVISANVLSQLPLIPMNHLSDADADKDLFARGIIDRHIGFLGSCSGAVCLVTEIERQFIDGGAVTGTEDPLFGVAPDIDGTEWFWDFAPKGEIAPHMQVRNRVRGGLFSP